MAAVQEEFQYSCKGMKFHPDFHFNQGKLLTVSEAEYLCKFYGFDHIQTIAFALGRTEASLMCTVHQLKKNGEFEYYKNLNTFC